MMQPTSPGAGLDSGGTPVIAGVPSRLYRVAWAGGAASQSLIQRCHAILFWSARETTGTAAATLRLLDSTGAGGALIVPVALVAGASIAQWLGPWGIPCAAGVYLDIVSGSAEGSIVVAMPL